MANGKFIAYYRASTAQQGRSGLGLEGQQGAVRAFLNGGCWQLLAEFTEVESGAHNARPELAKALTACGLKGATLVIAKLDRLSRDAHFLLGLAKAGVDFVAADMPNANRLTVGIMAMVAEEERRTISARTKAALAAAKARGVTLGGWRGGPKLDGRLGADANRKQAAAFAAKLAPIVGEMRSRGLSLRKIAAELATQGIRTQRGGQWSACAGPQCAPTACSGVAVSRKGSVQACQFQSTTRGAGWGQLGPPDHVVHRHPQGCGMKAI
jgi:DNA invertase Pin-like site-specific DNA recombinase